MKVTADHLARMQTPNGNFDLLVTNFNSPPDTDFIMRNVADSALLARRHGDRELFGWMEPTMQKAAGGLLQGGVHSRRLFAGFPGFDEQPFCP